MNECVSVENTPTFDSFECIQFQLISNTIMFLYRIWFHFSLDSQTIMLHNICMRIICLRFFFFHSAHYYYSTFFRDAMCIDVVIALNAKSPIWLKSIHGLMLGVFIAVAAFTCHTLPVVCTHHKQYTHGKVMLKVSFSH